jgi:4'-phosphopantetheinyl transferase
MKKIVKYCFNTSTWSPSRQEWMSLMIALPKDERESVARFMFKRDCKQSLIGRILARYCLKHLLNVEWNCIRLARTANDRPYVKLKETICMAGKSNKNQTASNLLSENLLVDFNLSHAGDYTIIAAGIIESASSSHSQTASASTTKQPDKSKKPQQSKASTLASEELEELFHLGTDVMKIDVERTRASFPEECDENIYQKELNKHDRVITSKFTNIEKNYIYNKINPVEKLTAFYRLWCLKESYVKAVGIGIGFDLKRIECSTNSELLIDTNSRRHIVASDTQLFVDGKQVCDCKFYEQYYTSAIQVSSRDSSCSKTDLHIMTLCIIEKQTGKAAKSTANSSNNNVAEKSGESDEFFELKLNDLLSQVEPNEVLDESNQQLIEDSWVNFNKKSERPLMA